MGLFSSFDHHNNNRLTIILNYFGKVSRLQFDKVEVQNENFFEILLERILQKHPHFQGSLAFYDKLGEKSLIDNTSILRQAVGKSSHNRLILHTIKDSDMSPSTEQKRINQTQSLQNFLGRRSFMQRRSTSVPPLPSPYSAFSSQNTTLTTVPSSIDAISFMERTNNNNKRHFIADDENIRHHHQSFSRNGRTTVINRHRMSLKSSDDTSLPPPQSASKGLPFSPHYYGQQALPYSQHLLYGMPPHNLLLAEFLSGGSYMFNPLIMSPLFATRRRAMWMGPNKYLSYGGVHMLAGGAGWPHMW